MTTTEALDVDVVHTKLGDAPDLSAFHALLNEDERARAAGYRRPEARDVFVLARGLLRRELARRLAVDARSIRFEFRASGKPDVGVSLRSQPDWRFSISHTGPHVAVALALGADVGIDIERLDRTVEPLSIARRYFTARELEGLESAPVDLRVKSFFAGWTRKEAIVKARGVTMAESLTTLSVDIDPEVSHPIYEDSLEVEPRARCRLATLILPDPSLIGAVALCSDRVPRLRLVVPGGPRFD